MSFIFPATNKHLPNDDQIRLLISFVNSKNGKFPGFLHTSLLKVNHRNRQVIHTKDDKKLYIMPMPMDVEALSSIISTSPYLFIPFSEPLTYIMRNSDYVIGLIRTKNLHTFWFEDSISIGEIATAVQRKVPIITKFVNIGMSNKACGLCNGFGALDWVDDIKFGNLYKKVPDKRYIFARYNHIYLLIDNQRIHSYDGDNLIHTCPRCLGSGMGGVLFKDIEKIKMINFDDTKYEFFSIEDARSDLIRSPEERYYQTSLAW